MDRTAITKYLAKEMGWTVKGDFKNNTIPSYYDAEGKWIMYVSDFDPFNDIRHAYLVEDTIAKLGEETQSDYIYNLRCVVSAELSPSYQWIKEQDAFELIHASSEQRTLAAFKALAPAELQEKWL